MFECWFPSFWYKWEGNGINHCNEDRTAIMEQEHRNDQASMCFPENGQWRLARTTNLNVIGAMTCDHYVDIAGDYY